MRLFYCLIALLFAEICVAQQVTRRVKYSPGGKKEVFYVLTSDTSKLHGRYRRMEKYARVEGFYKNGLQDGIWTEYATGTEKFMRVQGPYRDGQRSGLWTVYNSKRKLKSKGYYVNDQRTGYWRFYNINGEVEEEGNFENGFRSGTWSFVDDKGVLTQEYNYSSRKIVSDISRNALLQQPFKVINGADTLLTRLQEPPLYIGGRAKLCKPKIVPVPMKHDSMKVQVRFIIDKQGQAYNFYIPDPVDRWYDRQALDMVRHLTSAWMPARINGEAVEIEHTLTVLFRKAVTVVPVSSQTFYVNNSITPAGQYGTSPTRRIFLPPRPASIPSTRIQIL